MTRQQLWRIISQMHMIEVDVREEEELPPTMRVPIAMNMEVRSKEPLSVGHFKLAVVPILDWTVEYQIGIAKPRLFQIAKEFNSYFGLNVGCAILRQISSANINRDWRELRILLTGSALLRARSVFGNGTASNEEPKVPMFYFNAASKQWCIGWIIPKALGIDTCILVDVNKVDLRTIFPADPKGLPGLESHKLTGEHSGGFKVPFPPVDVYAYGFRGGGRR